MSFEGVKPIQSSTDIPDIQQPKSNKLNTNFKIATDPKSWVSPETKASLNKFKAALGIVGCGFIATTTLPAAVVGVVIGLPPFLLLAGGSVLLSLAGSLDENAKKTVAAAALVGVSLILLSIPGLAPSIILVAPTLLALGGMALFIYNLKNSTDAPLTSKKFETTFKSLQDALKKVQDADEKLTKLNNEIASKKKDLESKIEELSNTISETAQAARDGNKVGLLLSEDVRKGHESNVQLREQYKQQLTELNKPIEACEKELQLAKNELSKKETDICYLHNNMDKLESEEAKANCAKLLKSVAEPFLSASRSHYLITVRILKTYQ